MKTKTVTYEIEKLHTRNDGPHWKKPKWESWDTRCSNLSEARELFDRVYSNEGTRQDFRIVKVTEVREVVAKRAVKRAKR